MKDDKRNLPDERRTLLNRASYLYSNNQTRGSVLNKDNKGYEFTRMVVTTTVRGAKRTNKDNKGYEFTRMVVMTTVRGAKRTNKDNKGYEITRPVVTTAVRRNPNEQKKKKGLEMLERL